MNANGHKPTLVIAGTGMAGAKVAEEITRRAPERFQIRMFGAEPHGTYNRILLSSVLAGEADPQRLWLNPLDWYEAHGIRVHTGVRAETIDREKRVVKGGGGKVVEPFDHFIFATGSRPFVPPIDGVRQRGVFVFRTLDDCATIGAYAQECDTAIVLGGGLLGLEAARGLLNHAIDVTVVEMAPHLMPQQLDAPAALILQRKLEAMGVRFCLNAKTTALVGDGKVTGVRLADGTVVEADMVVVSCGIRPNVEEAKAAGLAVERGIVVDDQLRTSDPDLFAVGECAQHRGVVYGLVDPVYEQARVLADILCDEKKDAAYQGSRLATTLKVMGVDLTSMGDVHATGPDCEVMSHQDPSRGIYKKMVLRDGKLVGAILLGCHDVGGKLKRLFKEGKPLTESPYDLLMDKRADSPIPPGGASSNGCSPLPPGGTGSNAFSPLPPGGTGSNGFSPLPPGGTGSNGFSPLPPGGEGSGVRGSPTSPASELASLPDSAQICNCNAVCKGTIVQAIQAGKCTVGALGDATRAGTGCGTCQPLLQQLLDSCGTPTQAPVKNKIEIMKEEKNGLDALDDLLALAQRNAWEDMTEDDKQRAKWYGLFFRKPTPGNFMLRLRFNAGRTSARQFRVLADLSDEFGKGFCDLTTRQQIQLRWFTLGDVPEIWRRLEEVGLHSKQTGMDNVRGVCGCPVAGLTPHELLDATPVVRAFDDLILGNREFSNLPRKFNATITGCMENCCHTETQDIALVPAFRELDGQQVNGFNVLVGGKQGSGGYRPATPLNVFVRPEDAADLCADIVRVFRDHGSRATRNRARLAFLIEDRGAAWFRQELERRWDDKLLHAGTDMRKKHHVDHLGIHPQKKDVATGKTSHYVGFLVPVGRITTAQMRAVADVAEKYGTGDIRVTVGQNLIIPNVPEEWIGALADEPIFRELPYDPSPIMRGLVACTGTDYCGMALIETKGYALEVARELERRTEGRKIAPLSIHWSGCPAGCGLHQVGTIGLQGCRSRVNGQVVDAAHVSVGGKTGPNPVLATDLMYDVPITQLADALEPLVCYLPRK